MRRLDSDFTGRPFTNLTGRVPLPARFAFLLPSFGRGRFAFLLPSLWEGLGEGRSYGQHAKRRTRAG